MSEQNSFLIYQDDNGISNVNVRFEGEGNNGDRPRERGILRAVCGWRP